jgi:hypothetical protein
MCFKFIDFEVQNFEFSDELFNVHIVNTKFVVADLIYMVFC